MSSPKIAPREPRRLRQSAQAKHQEQIQSPPIKGLILGSGSRIDSGPKVACVEEIAYRQGYIDAAQLARPAEPMKKNGYGQTLLGLLNERVF